MASYTSSMGCRIHKLVRCVALIVSVSVLGLADAPRASETPQDEPVRVYTNADLEALEPLPVSQAAVGGEELGWSFVLDFIDAQRAQIRERRAYELERTRIEAEAQVLREHARPWSPARRYLPLIVPYGPHAPRPAPTEPAAERPSPFAPGSPRDWIVPLHARDPL